MREGGEGQNGKGVSHDTLRNLDFPPVEGKVPLKGFENESEMFGFRL